MQTVRPDEHRTAHRSKAQKWADKVMGVLKGREVVGVEFDGGDAFVPQRMELTLDNGQKLVIEAPKAHLIIACDAFTLMAGSTGD